MKLDIIDINNLAEDLPEITSYKLIENGKFFVKGGLFSQQIFGPTKSYHCSCPRSIYRGPNSKEKKCDVCNVDITSSKERRKRFAKIVLPFPLINPLMYYVSISGKTSVKRVVDDIMYFRKRYIINDNNELEIVESENDVKNTLHGVDGVIEYIKFICNQDKNSEKSKFILNNLHNIKLNNVLVIPPDFRNCGKSSNGKYLADNLNEYYSQIIKICNYIKDLPFDITENEEIYRENFKYLQNNILKIYDFIIDKLSKKTGLIRSNILGKRVDFSGRSVISPNPSISLSECVVPYVSVLEILKPQLTAHLVNRKICKRYNQAASLIDKHIQDRNPLLFKLVGEFCKNFYVIINRQPTLHRMSVLAFKLKIHLGNTIQIHPMITHALNADFDGDSVAMYIPVTDISIKETNDKISIWNNLISPADNSSVPQPNQDIILGIYTATK